MLATIGGRLILERLQLVNASRNSHTVSENLCRQDARLINDIVDLKREHDNYSGSGDCEASLRNSGSNASARLNGDEAPPIV
ncbi:uncharacterized protein N7482_001766 [Penicillium canariense]|uniref:Uncharacterized protein n=1 Tax=Penicillium canariense TaxID=189055 RepID=A0A9W9IGL7_9EURO|nr:uncharacterized protein N7482_001766 [Penicillium canariense]KAJ5175889.1 hypothetical protein N7482_001766 [Penicillium canariense]